MAFSCNVDTWQVMNHQSPSSHSLSLSLSLSPALLTCSSFLFFPPFAEVSSHIPNIPFKHHVLLLPALSTATQAYETYLHLLTLAKKDLADYGQEPQCYNVVMTRKWVAVIPRRTAEGPYGGNAAGMVGIVYLPNAEERERWKVEGYGDVLVRFGLPV
jgi:ATP adenylyltransferase